MEKQNFGFGGGNQYSGFSFTQGQDVGNLVREVQELHNLDENTWAFRKYKKNYGVPACRGSYHSGKKTMRVRIDIKAPVQKVMTYMLKPPFGLSHQIVGGYQPCQVVEKVGGGGAVIYQETPTKAVCCCSIAARDAMVLSAVSLPSSDTAIFGMKSIEHSSHPATDDVYRIDIPLIGVYLQQEGDTTHVESYIAEMDLKGKLGKIGPGKAMEQIVNETMRLARAIPGMPDVNPPYMEFL